jgi:hypothetical protein
MISSEEPTRPCSLAANRRFASSTIGIRCRLLVFRARQARCGSSSRRREKHGVLVFQGSSEVFGGEIRVLAKPSAKVAKAAKAAKAAGIERESLMPLYKHNPNHGKTRTGNSFAAHNPTVVSSNLPYATINYSAAVIYEQLATIRIDDIEGIRLSIPVGDLPPNRAGACPQRRKCSSRLTRSAGSLARKPLSQTRAARGHL